MAAKVSYMYQFALLWLMLFCHLVVFIECEEKKDLTVFRGNEDVTSQVFINGSNDCLTSFDSADLPPEVNGIKVERPGDFHVSTLDTLLLGKYLVTGIHVRWSSPIPGADRNIIKGFYVLMEAEKYEDRCRLYIINHTAFDDVLNFGFTMENFAQRKDNFQITIYSLPPPLTMNQTRTFRTALVTSKEVKTISYPGSWVPTISIKASLDEDNLGSVDVYFPFPPNIDGWHLKEFMVMLVKCSHSLNDYFDKSEPNIIKDETSTATEGHWQFQGLNQDIYSVVVRVVNHDRGNDTSCICRTAPDFCENSCESAQTAWFDLSGNKHKRPNSSQTVSQDSCIASPTTTTTTTTTSTIITEPPLLEETRSDSTELPGGGATTEESLSDDDTLTSEVLVGVIVAVLVIGVLTFLLIAYLCCKQRRGKKWQKSAPANSRTKLQIPSSISHDAQNGLRKLVYIMATADHQASIQVLDAFCDLLEKYCACDVIDPRKEVLTQTCESAWVTASMAKSDCLVFVNFKGTETLVDALLDDQPMPTLDPNHSLLHKALQIAFNSHHSNHRHFMSVTFTQDWTQDKLALLKPKKFVLPKELTAFLAGVHNLTEQHTKKHLKNSHLSLDPFEKLPEFQALKEAVKELTKFENNNQEFFDTNYNIIWTTSTKPPASISSSVSSGCSSTMDGNQLGSLTDISPDGDSPVSVFEQPSFQQIPTSPDDGIDMDESNIFSIGSDPDGYKLMRDGQSFVTVGQFSDMPDNDSQKGGQPDRQRVQPIPPRTMSKFERDDLSTALRQTNEDCRISEPSTPKEPQLLQVLVPPCSKIKVSNEDTISTKIADLNADNSSVWSKPSDFIPSCHIETEKKGRPPIIKPPRLSIPTDNASTMLEALNHKNAPSHERDEFYDSGLPEMFV